MKFSLLFRCCFWARPGEELRYIIKFACAIFGFLVLSATVAAQQYVISTYVGGAPPPTPASAVGVPFGQRLALRRMPQVMCTSLACIAFSKWIRTESSRGSPETPELVIREMAGQPQARNWAHGGA